MVPSKRSCQPSAFSFEVKVFAFGAQLTDTVAAARHAAMIELNFVIVILLFKKLLLQIIPNYKINHKKALIKPLHDTNDKKSPLYCYLYRNKTKGQKNMLKKISFGIAMIAGLCSCAASHDTLSQDEKALREHITQGMPQTVREMHADDQDVIALPYTYSVPTIRGMFQEMYYWDTFYTNEGLLMLGNADQARSNVDNILYMIEHFGYMPNGTHKGLLNRSQPPYSSMMVRSVYETTGDKQWLAQAYTTLEKEHTFWMTQRLAPNGLNRYGHCATDEELVGFYGAISGRLRTDRSETVKTLADTLKASAHWLAEAESGWDFNPRYSQRCMDFNPVDLNALLYVFERNMAWFSKELGNGRTAEWDSLADNRKSLIQKYCFNPEDGLFHDYDFVNECWSKVLSGGVFNLMYAGIMTKKQAAAMVKALPRLEMEHGVAACEDIPSELTYQWAFPNAWAAINYMAIRGMDRYGFRSDARRLARKYLDSNVGQFKETGVLWEKYNATTGRNDAASEYGTPGDFMGWTAGVVLFTMDYLCGKSE